MSDFAPLHNHSVFSALDGVSTPEEYFKEGSSRKYPAISLTEHGNMASVPDAHWASQETGVKFIPGIELYYNDHELERRKLEEKGIKPKDIDNETKKIRLTRQRHLTVLCKSMIGYENLLRVRQESYNYFFYKPRTNIAILKKHHKGLIILSGCMNGPISFELRQHIKTESDRYWQNAIKLAKMYKEIFKDDFYVELQMPGVEDDVQLFALLQKLADELKIETVLTNDAHYINEEDYNLQRIMMSIEQDKPYDSPDLFISKSKSGYFKTRDQLRDTFQNGHKVGNEVLPPYNKEVSLKDFERACDNTLVIADKCDWFKPDTSTKLPTIKDAEKIIEDLVVKGLREKGLIKKKEYIKRAKFELDRIIEKEFCSYFLICRDLVRKSTVDLDMPVGPRGSAAGSLVCYLIGIHDVDPIQWSLSFDRFLSSSRGGKMLRMNMDKDEER